MPLTMTPNQLVARCLAISLGVVAFGGSGGVAPGDGTYGFYRTPPGTHVADGTFTTTGGAKNLHINPDGRVSTNWKQESDGQYHRDPDPGPPANRYTLCFHHDPETDPSTTYIYKFDGEPLSSGYLTN